MLIKISLFFANRNVYITNTLYTHCGKHVYIFSIKFVYLEYYQCYCTLKSEHFYFESSIFLSFSSQCGNLGKFSICVKIAICDVIVLSSWVVSLLFFSFLLLLLHSRYLKFAFLYVVLIRRHCLHADIHFLLTWNCVWPFLVIITKCKKNGDLSSLLR